MIEKILFVGLICWAASQSWAGTTKTIFAYPAGTAGESWTTAGSQIRVSINSTGLVDFYAFATKDLSAFKAGTIPADVFQSNLQTTSQTFFSGDAAQIKAGVSFGVKNINVAPFVTVTAFIEEFTSPATPVDTNVIIIVVVVVVAVVVLLLLGICIFIGVAWFYKIRGKKHDKD